MSESSEDVTLRILLDELKGCRKQIDGLVKDVANLKAEERRISMFLEDGWGPLKTEIQGIKNRVDVLESEDFKELERRVDKVEQHVDLKLPDRVTTLEMSEAKRQGIAATAGAVTGGGIAALIRFLFGSG